MTWTKSAIRAARQSDLAPILVSRGYRLAPLKNDNFGIVPDWSTTITFSSDDNYTYSLP